MANKSYVFMGTSNVIRYSISITNLGDETANDVKVKDILGYGASFIEGSLFINGCRFDNFKFNKDIILENIAPNENVMINLDVQVQRNCPPNSISNKVVVSYIDKLGASGTVESKTLIIPIVDINIYLTKSVDKKVANVGEVVNYLVLIRNNSTIDINNVIFFDFLPLNLVLLPSSVLVNSEVQYIDTFNNGLSIGTIKAKSSVVVSFDVEILASHNLQVINNVSKIVYSYTISDNNIPVTSGGEATSNCTITKILTPRPCCY